MLVDNLNQEIQQMVDKTKPARTKKPGLWSRMSAALRRGKLAEPERLSKMYEKLVEYELK